MLLLAALLRLGLSTRWIGMIGVVLILCHNLFDLEVLSRIGGDPRSPNAVWVLLLRPGAIPLTSDRVLLVGYPLLPWFGVMAAGFGFGPVLLFDRRSRIRLTAITGIVMVLLFIALRAGNVYGDPRPWRAEDTVPKTVLSFVNCQKYPPSLLFLLMTLGPGLLALAAFEATEDSLIHSTGPIRRALETLGRVPLFFYVLQWPVIHILTDLAAWVSGQPIDWFSWSFDYPSGYGYSLPVVYAMWVVVVAILYVPSRWYAGLKKGHRDWAWLSYL
jgi:uncharacterized membrane protein